MKDNGHKKIWGKMSASELAKATREFDKPLPASRYRPLTKAERARFERARRAGGKGSGRVLSFDVDPALLTRAIAVAKRKRWTVDQVIERGLRRELAVED